MKNKSSSYKSGRLAELLARMYLRLQGYSIVSKNHITGRGTKAGELDIIAKRGHTIAFVEVKKRKTLEDASYAISENQKQRIRRGSEAFLQKHPEYQNCDIRYDAILVKLPFTIKHIKSAW